MQSYNNTKQGNLKKIKIYNIELNSIFKIFATHLHHFSTELKYKFSLLNTFALFRFMLAESI